MDRVQTVKLLGVTIANVQNVHIENIVEKAGKIIFVYYIN